MNMSIMEMGLVCTMGIVGIVPVTLTLCYCYRKQARLGRSGKLVALSLHCFCAYSAHCLWGGYTWGVTPGFILMRLQCAVIARLFTFFPKWLQIVQRRSREMKRPTSTFLKTAPSSLKMAPTITRVASFFPIGIRRPASFTFLFFYLLTFNSSMTATERTTA